MTAFLIILGAFALLSSFLLLWQWVAAQRFPLHQEIALPAFTPGVTILKPLKGCDATTAASLETWLVQEYAGPVQILFGVADAADPVVAVVRGLLAAHPERNARLIICGPLQGVNAKVAKLAQLEALAQHENILIADADVRVPRNFLHNFVAPLAEPQCGLVNSFYRLANPVTNAMRWEAIAINADFWSQVLQSQMLKPLDFALGATILIRRQVLAEMGGFRALADCLADDYQLGHRTAQKGHTIALCPTVVECWDAPMGWRQVWKHQLRWARTIRVCQPVPYFFSILSNAGFWPMIWLLAALATGPHLCQALTAVALLLIRTALAQSLQ